MQSGIVDKVFGRNLKKKIETPLTEFLNQTKKDLKNNEDVDLIDKKIELFKKLKILYTNLHMLYSHFSESEESKKDLDEHFCKVLNALKGHRIKNLPIEPGGSIQKFLDTQIEVKGKYREYVRVLNTLVEKHNHSKSENTSFFRAQRNKLTKESLPTYMPIPEPEELNFDGLNLNSGINN
ncbi:hypothetical protein [Legionella fairfieldensis]|uniref:hypothetical protein n=1 Tax=Legionella fairfieldensis TaxID=45064 RepID=UPI000491634A|nr:hypothetical protein [Legionella fairfieldensis]